MGHLALDPETGELELQHTLPLRGAGGAAEQIEMSSILCLRNVSIVSQ